MQNELKYRGLPPCYVWPQFAIQRVISIIYILIKPIFQMYLLWRIGWLLLCLAAATGYVECHQQKPLGDQKPLSYPTFTIREQKDELCDAASRFWTGTVNITADKSMFFCKCIFSSPETLYLH